MGVIWFETLCKFDIKFGNTGKLTGEKMITKKWSLFIIGTGIILITG